MTAANGIEIEAKPDATAPASRFNTAMLEEVANARASGQSRSTKPLGFSLFLWGNDDAPGRDKYRMMIEGAKYFDRHGFEAVWTPERHFHAFGGPYPNPSITGAAIAAITERIGIRAGSCVSPLHHSIRIAEEWAVVDNLSNGRVAIAFASGWQLNDFILRPENHAQNKRVLLEQIDQVRRLWRGEKINFRNPLGQEVAVQTLPRPVQSELPVWITTSGNQETYRQAGELGANVLTHLLGQTVEELAKKIAMYRQARAAAGHDPATGRVTLMLHTFVGDDDDTVRRWVRQPMKDYLRSSLKLVAELADSAPSFRRSSHGVGRRKEEELRDLSEAEIEAMLEVAFERYFETSGLFGTPSTCARMAERCRKAGVDEIACLLDFGVPTDRVLASLPGLKELREQSNINGNMTDSSCKADPSVVEGVASADSSSVDSERAVRARENTQIYTFLTRLRDCGVQVWADGDHLRCNAPSGTLTPVLRDELQQRKNDILRFLRSARTIANQPRAIVPLQPSGKLPPIFAVAGHNGDVFCYRALVKHLGEDQPFFGLQPPGLDGQSEPLVRVEDLASNFSAQIREFGPSGPCVIAGYCSGGGIALELARQLVRDGVPVSFLALFGSPFPTWYRPVAQLRARLGLQVDRVIRHTRAMAPLSLTERWSYLSQKLREHKTQRAAEQHVAPDPVLTSREEVGRATFAALSRYEPGHFAGRVNLFVPDQWLCPKATWSQWRSVAQSIEEYFGPDGSTGDTMLREPHASALAELFERCRAGCESSR